MYQNKSLPFILGAVVIFLAGAIVFVQYSKNTKNQTANQNSIPVETTKPNTTSTYNIATVALHNSSSDCWTIVNSSVYNVTSWISKHPGGAAAIKSMCGVDASAAFNGQHGGQARPASELASFKIGTLSK